MFLITTDNSKNQRHALLQGKSQEQQQQHEKTDDIVSN